MTSDKTKPTYLRGRKPVQVKVHDIMQVLAMIDDHGETENFMTAAKTSGAVMSIHPKTVNFFKDFIANHATMSTQTLGAKVTNPQDCDGTYECKF